MRFDIITIFPKIIEAYLGASVIKRARAKKLIYVRVHDLRMFSSDKKHRTVDDRPYGGGPGMVLQTEPLARAIQKIPKNKKYLAVLFSAGGKQFDAKMACQWARQYDQILMIAGRYEGVDERIKKIFKMQEISIGSYVLTGGEVPVLVVMDAVARYIPSVLGDAESLEEKRHGIGVPVYTRPEVFLWRKKKYCVPKILLSGDHKKIDEWRALRGRNRAQ